jgi:hypothetical protein
MHRQDHLEAEARRVANAFTVRVARRRYRVERQDVPFRAFCRRTYNAFACAGKLAAIVARKEL